MSHKIETIFALATPTGRSGVAVIRVSGPKALESAQNLAKDLSNIEPRYAYFTPLYTAPDKLLDHGILIYFKAPHSFTGEDIVEFQLHGSPAIIQELLRYLSSLPYTRHAERGEFTRRAYENGRMDLTEAEAIADLIDAETATQKEQALAQLSGSLKNLYEDWAHKLSRVLAYLEADLDFPDEDLPDGIAQQILPQIDTIINDVQNHLNDNRRGERLRNGIKIAVIGAPNAGKSSLVNALAQREVAITSDFAGTTRDILEIHLDLGGYPVILYDTAGLKPELLLQEGATAQDKIESEGIKRALKAAQDADLKLLVFDSTQPEDTATLSLQDANSIIVYNKIDLLSTSQKDKLSYSGLMLSVMNHDNLTHLLETLTIRISSLMGKNDHPALTRERHREHLQECLQSLNRARRAPLPELIAEDVRLAVRALGKITGRVDVEDLLDIIFSEFCIGK